MLLLQRVSRLNARMLLVLTLWEQQRWLRPA
jgi:hypothetical protein